MGAWLEQVERTEKRRSNRNESMIDDEQRGEYRKNDSLRTERESLHVGVLKNSFD